MSSHRLNRRQLTQLATLSWAMPSGVALAQTATASLSVEYFFRSQQLTRAEMNPAGTHVAMLIGGDAQKRRVVLVELATLKPQVLLSLDTVDVMGLHWVNDRRLIVHDGIEDTNSDDWRNTQLYAIDIDGENFRRLGAFMNWGEGTTYLDAYTRWIAQAPDLGDEVLMAKPTDTSQGMGYLSLWRLHTRTGAKRAVELPAWTSGFLVDAKGEPVAVKTFRDGVMNWLGRQEDGRWKVLHQAEAYLGDGMDFVGLDSDGSWWVTTRGDRDHRALYDFDPKTGALADKPLLALAGFDVDAEPLLQDGRLLGVTVNADARTTVWFDPALKDLQAKVDAKLPATQNLLQSPRKPGSPWLLVWAYSDKRPARLFALHRETLKLTLLGSTRPHIDPAAMSGMDFVRYSARDGRSIPAYLTLPASTGDQRPLPLVVLVHGGPWVRGASWGWDREVQFLASRGYAVLQPEFRGGDGFGRAHLEAGFRQWGLAMQDDLADGVKWAVAQGIADPKRVAIVGASYGGYAAMMGLVRHPELYRCAVNWVGVTDLDLMFSAHWSDVPGIAKRLGYARVIGDPKADAEMFKANSPVHQAERIRQPVLMAYGRWDQRVPIEHGERMRDALKRHNTQLEWVQYDKEGHGWYRLETNIDFWTRVENFLARHLR